MSLVVDMPFGLESLDKVFAVSELLDNQDELIAEFKPEVEKFMVRKDFFKGPFRVAYENAFDDLIVRLIKRQIIKHHPSWTPEDVLLLTDKAFLKMITNNFYFDQVNYQTKEGINE